MKHISALAFKEVIDVERANESVDFINVCTTAEYKEKHIPGVRSIPLDELQNHVREFDGKKTIYVHCRSGNRGRKALEKLTELGVRAELVNVEGGIMAWEELGYPIGSHTNRPSLMRQVMILAGSLILLGHVLFMFFGAPYLLLSAFVGAGLVFAGTTGWCGLAFLLAKMPWNK